jgi:putative transposase
MGRIARVLIENGVYHIVARGNNKQNIFKKHQDYSFYLHLLQRYRLKYEVKIYHYALMPNHVHMIIEANPKPLISFMHGISLSYAQHFQKKYTCIGHFWQDRYKSHIIEKEVYLARCARYIELNPVRAQIAARPEDYPYSSYNFYAWGKKSDIITPDPLYLDSDSNIQKRQIQYRELVAEGINETLEVKEKHFLASDEFIKQTLYNELSYRTRFKKGRPRKNSKKIIRNLL